MGQSKFTNPIRDAIIEALKKGNYAKTAAAMVGIHYTTLFDWLKKGNEEQDDPASEYAQFARDVDQARANALSESIQAIRDAGKDDWRAHAWWAERAHPDLYALKDWRKGQQPDAEEDFEVDISPSPDAVPDGGE